MHIPAFFALSCLLIHVQDRAVIGKSPNYIEGIVTNKNSKEPLEKATIRVLKLPFGVASDTKGFYKLVVPDSLLNKKIVLQFDYAGFISLKKEVYLKRLPLVINAKLEEKMIRLDNVIQNQKNSNH